MTARQHPRPDTIDYKQIFLRDTPLIDVRAPAEYAKGAFPTAVNLPLMDDAERKAVGITYKEAGQQAAIESGHALVRGKAKAARVEAWRKHADQHPEGYLYCMRGGLRSRISQQWMDEAGTAYPLVKGGYKALRRYLIEATEQLVKAQAFIVVAGRTGVGKTLLLKHMNKSVDLEGMANHRGSSFGRRLGDQPTQINFENQLAIRLLKITDGYVGPIFIEDESRRIGCLELPQALAVKMASSPAVMIDEPMESRIEAILQDYVTDLLPTYQKAFREDGFRAFGEFLLEALHRIRKRLGGERYDQIEALMRAALQHQEKTGGESLHRDWILALLKNYYDPMYDYQLANHSRNIVFRGSRAEVLAWHREHDTGA